MSRVPTKIGLSAKNENPAEPELGGGVSGTLLRAISSETRFLMRAPPGKQMGRAKSSSRNVRHKQPVGHALSEVPDHPCFSAGDRDAGDRDRERLRSELDDICAVSRIIAELERDGHDTAGQGRLVLS